MNESIDLEQDGRTWMTKSELAEHFGCDKRTIGNWMRRKIIPFVKIRGVLRFNLRDCEAALCQYRQKPFWDSGKPAARDTVPVPQQTSPPPPDEAPPSPPSFDTSLILLKGQFTNREQVERALAALGERNNFSKPTACSIAEIGKWILLLIPGGQDRDFKSVTDNGADTVRDIQLGCCPKD